MVHRKKTSCQNGVVARFFPERKLLTKVLFAGVQVLGGEQLVGVPHEVDVVHGDEEGGRVRLLQLHEHLVPGVINKPHVCRKCRQPSRPNITDLACANGSVTARGQKEKTFVRVPHIPEDRTLSSRWSGRVDGQCVTGDTCSAHLASA